MSDPDACRPYWGEEEEVLSGPSFPAPEQFTATYEQRRQAFIEAGECPMPACHEPLDEGACPRCGWSLLEEKLQPRTVEDKPDYVRTLPGALVLGDEYAPAEVDAA